MISRHLRLLALFAVSAVIATACTSGGDAAETSTTATTTVPETTTTTLPPTTTTVSETTTTTEPSVEVSEAINGLPAEQDLIDRRVVAIKIDNHVRARPQSALQSADAVFEIPVEGGITRFIALFHQSDLDWVGPNRSGRPTDSKVMTTFPEAPLQISGAQPWVKDIFRSDGVNVVYDTGATTFRQPGRPAPHNLFTSTTLIRDWADARGWPDEGPGNLFAYGEPTPSDAEATRIEVSFSDAETPTWAWDGTRYLRFHGTTPHEWINEDGDTGQVAFDTLVVMKMRRYIQSDPSRRGSSVPAMDTVGKGEAFVFYNGQVVGGTWERGSKNDRFFLATADGVEIVLPPGRVWISLQPDNQPLVWE
ncbi:MAG: DUF3048 domain-containing protein [Acidimicrobiia bacterium]